MADLLAVADRDLADSASPPLSPDWRHNIAYNAVLRLASLALAAAGYRAAREAQHYYVIQSLALTVGWDQGRIERLDTARRRRNRVAYETAGMVSRREAEELRALAQELRDATLAWLRLNHPELAP